MLSLCLQDKRTMVNWKDKKTGSTPLHVAASKNYVKIMAYLLQRIDIRPNEKDVRALFLSSTIAFSSRS